MHVASKSEVARVGSTSGVCMGVVRNGCGKTIESVLVPQELFKLSCQGVYWVAKWSLFVYFSISMSQPPKVI